MPGSGKSTLLTEVASRAQGFESLYAEGVDPGLSPYSVLEQWGALRSGADPSSDVEVSSPSIAAQHLRARIDELGGRGPLLLMLDDLQWADPESVESLTWLLRRAAGDQLLVAVGSRPLDAEQHPGLQRHLRDPQLGVRLPLDGLTRSSAAQLVHQFLPSATEERVTELWSHTEGNPLYLTALLREYGASLLEDVDLPAPAQFVRVIEARLERVSPAARTSVEAISVAAPGWLTLAEATALSGHSATHATPELLRESLIELHTTDGIPSLRIAHALTRSAIYQQIPLSRRQELHRHAAEQALSPSDALDHRVAAADTWDDELAEQLEQRARQFHDSSSHRLAAHDHRRAAALTSDPALRLRRRWDALFDDVQAGQLRDTTSELPGLDAEAEPVRSALVTGAAYVLSGRWEQGIALLGPIGRRPLEWDRPDPLPRVRAECLYAWALNGSGAPTESVLSALSRARSLEAEDPTITPYRQLLEGQLAVRLSSPESMLDRLTSLPPLATDFPLDQTYALAWRAFLRISVGLFGPGNADLQEAQQRIQMGLTDITYGSFHSLLGASQWYRGQWDLAEVNFRLATELSDGLVGAQALAVLPLVRCTVGDFAEADRRIDNAIQVIRRMPWTEAVQALMITRVVRHHAAADAQGQATLLPETQRLWPDVELTAGVSNPTLVHLAQAAIWADDLATAEELVIRMESANADVPWKMAATAWLRGLVQERRGADTAALNLLRQGCAADSSAYPLLAAHVRVDAGRLADRVGEREESQHRFGDALRRYRMLGATPYVERLMTMQTRETSSPAPDQPSQREADAAPNISLLAAQCRLSEREQDIATLIAAGLSYAQIARDLFVTQSTVSYHLTNIYAKAGVRGRHQLVALARGQS